MKRTITVDGSGQGGVVTVGDLRELLAGLAEADTDRPVRARTTVGGKLKRVTVEGVA